MTEQNQLNGRFDNLSFSLIVAMDLNDGIGLNNSLPWYYPEDLQEFRKRTANKSIIMGRKTWESIYAKNQKPLPLRQNIVITKSLSETIQLELSQKFENLFFVSSVELAKQLAIQLNSVKLEKGLKVEVFVIGGARIYKQFLGSANKIYLTLIKKEFECDTYFHEWKKYFTRTTNQSQLTSTDGTTLVFKTLIKH